MTNKAESNARVHERKAQRMADVYTKAKSENDNLYIANKKLWGQVNDTKESPIIGKHKQSRLKQKSIIGKMNILWSSKN